LRRLFLLFVGERAGSIDVVDMVMGIMGWRLLFSD
jgi:hypothetical protein